MDLKREAIKWALAATKNEDAEIAFDVHASRFVASQAQEVPASLRSRLQRRITINGDSAWIDGNTWGGHFLKGLDLGERLLITANGDLPSGVQRSYELGVAPLVQGVSAGAVPSYLIVGLRNPVAAEAMCMVSWEATVPALVAEGKAATMIEGKWVPRSPAPETIPPNPRASKRVN